MPKKNNSKRVISDNKSNILEQNTKTEEDLLKIANDMWKMLKDLIKKDPKFMETDDNKKLDFFRNELKMGEFMDEFPITCRYMICMGQYSKRAFKRFLDKVRIGIKNMPPPNERDKNYMEDQWIRRQSDYVRFLWEAYQKGHFDRREAQSVWEDAYKKLKGEFDDFRGKYDEIKESSKKEKKELDASRARELLERLSTGKQKLDNNDSTELLFLLKNRLYKKRFNNMVKQINTDITVIPASCNGVGVGPAMEDEKNKPVIKMIERVSEEEYEKIPDNLRINE